MRVPARHVRRGGRILDPDRIVGVRLEPPLPEPVREPSAEPRRQQAPEPMQPSSQVHRQAADDTSCMSTSSGTFARMDPGSERTAAVSLIVTVRDDRPGFAELLDAIAEQVEMPDEIVVVDGGSTDGTLDELTARTGNLPPVRVFVAPGSNIGAGRNIAVREARHDWIVCTDAGCRPVPGWLAAFKRASGVADIAAGTWVVEGDTPLDRAVACAHYPVLEEVHDEAP